MPQIDYTKIPDKLFKKTVKVRDIRLARILNRQEKYMLAPGSPDIIIASPLGVIHSIDRDTFVNRFTYLNGEKISLAGWKAQHKYPVVTQDHVDVYVLYLPAKYKVTYGGKSEKVINTVKRPSKGSFIVCPTKPDGSINRGKAYIISRELYMKMFLPPRSKQTTRADLNNSKPIKANVEKSTKEYVVVGKLMRANKIVGFVVQHVSGCQRRIDKKTLIAMCKSKKIQNICLVEQDGKEFIRGVGIKISDLPNYDM